MNLQILPQYPDLQLNSEEFECGFMVIRVYVRAKPYIGPAFKLCYLRDENLVSVSQDWKPSIGVFYQNADGKTVATTLEYIANIFMQVAALENNFVDALHAL